MISNFPTDRRLRIAQIGAGILISLLALIISESVNFRLAVFDTDLRAFIYIITAVTALLLLLIPKARLIGFGMVLFVFSYIIISLLDLITSGFL